MCVTIDLPCCGSGITTVKDQVVVHVIELQLQLDSMHSNVLSHACLEVMVHLVGSHTTCLLVTKAPIKSFTNQRY